MGVKWSDASDRDLLLCIVAESQITATKWSAIANRMQAKGHEFSGSACSQHFTKLRKDSEGNGSGHDSPNTKTANSKAKKSARPAVGKKRKNAIEDIDEENQDDDEQFIYPTPTKKQKVRSVVKEEGDNGRHLEQEDRSIVKYETVNENGQTFIDLENDDMYLDALEF